MGFLKRLKKTLQDLSIMPKPKRSSRKKKKKVIKRKKSAIRKTAKKRLPLKKKARQSATVILRPKAAPKGTAPSRRLGSTRAAEESKRSFARPSGSLRMTKRKKTKAPVKKAKSKSKISKGVFIGTVTHYFPHVNAAAVKIEGEVLKVGDRVHIKGATTNLKQLIKSLQINRIPIDAGRKGEEVGIQVRGRVRQQDQVFRIST